MGQSWNPEELEQDLREHATFELDSMVLAATAWHAARSGASGAQCPFHDGFAQDSTFLHARALYEFFCERKGAAPQMRVAAGVDEPLTSEFWGDEDSQTAFQLKVFHLSGYRPHVPGERPEDDLHEQVVTIAADVLALWTQAIDEVDDRYREVMDAGRIRAVGHAAWLADQLSIAPLF